MRVARIPIAIAGSLLVVAMLVMLAPMAEAKTSVSYPGGCTIVPSHLLVFPLERITVTATGFPVGAKVTFTLRAVRPPPRPVVVGSAIAKANKFGTGTATLVFRVPLFTRPGLHTITAVGVPPGQCDPIVSSNIMVLASTTATTVSTGGGTLPRTGTNSALLFQIALILIALGGLVTLAARKRLAHARVDS